MKILLQKWPFSVMAVILLIALFIVPSTAALAADPPSDPAIPTELKCYGGVNGGSWGTYVDIYFKEGSNTGPLAGWCADEEHNITVGTWYTDIVYDYFGYDYPNNSYYLPDFVTQINWNAIAWVLNHDSEYSMKEIQQAVWIIVYSDDSPDDYGYRGLSADLGGGSAAEKAAALALANAGLAHSSFVPEIGKDIRPVICYSVDPGDNQVQVLFFQFGGGTPPPPLPELPTVVLLGMGIVGLAGFIVIKRRSKVTTAK